MVPCAAICLSQYFSMILNKCNHQKLGPLRLNKNILLKKCSENENVMP